MENKKTRYDAATHHLNFASRDTVLQSLFTLYC